MNQSHYWFDDYYTHASAGVFLLTPDHRLVLQLRDNIPEIACPGMITPFAGAAEQGETPIDCALRELAEETGLEPRPEDLRPLGMTSGRDIKGRPLACAYFLLTDVDPEGLVVTEGRPIILPVAEIASEPRLTDFCRRFCEMIAANLPPLG